MHVQHGVFPFFTWVFDHKWSLHVSTHFQTTLCWQNVQYSKSPDAQNPFKNSQLCILREVTHFWIFLADFSSILCGHFCMFTLHFFFGRGREWFWSDTWVVPNISDPVQGMLSSDKNVPVFFWEQNLVKCRPVPWYSVFNHRFCFCCLLALGLIMWEMEWRQNFSYYFFKLSCSSG